MDTYLEWHCLTRLITTRFICLRMNIIHCPCLISAEKLMINEIDVIRYPAKKL